MDNIIEQSNIEQFFADAIRHVRETGETVYVWADKDGAWYAATDDSRIAGLSPDEFQQVTADDVRRLDMTPDEWLADPAHDGMPNTFVFVSHAAEELYIVDRDGKVAGYTGRA